MRKEEIGGYLELENFSGGEYYPNLCRLNLGRTALIYLMDALGCRKLYLPWFLCDSVTSVCREQGWELRFYHIREDFTPILEGELQEGEYLYLVNYYGQLTDQRLLEYKKKYGRIIADHTHSFFQRPLPGIPTLYSCRKFFGLPDGAYLSLEAAPPYPLERDQSRERMGHLLGRYEETASSHFQEMHATASSFYGAPVKSMSRLTENLLRAIDYEACRKRRNENYSYLSRRLASRSPRTFLTPQGPLCYPFYTPGGPELRKALAGQKIYVPTYWGNVLSEMPEDSTEYDLAANILPLPCDHRYNLEDMEAVASAVIEYLEKHHES